MNTSNPVELDASTADLSLDPTAALNQMQGFLKAKDDTSRFVGLAVLKSVLDNQQDLRDDTEKITALWNSISPKFLDRLLRAGQNNNVTTQEAKDMIDIAVSVFHTFAILLPEQARRERRFTGRFAALTNALLHTSPDTTILVQQGLLTLCSVPEGASELLDCEDISPLTEIAVQQPMVLDIFSSSLSNLASQSTENQKIALKMDTIVTSLVLSFRDTDAVTLLSFIGDILPKLPSECLPTSPKWIDSLISSLKSLVTSRPTSAGRSAYSQASAALLQAFPDRTSSLLFANETKSSKDEKPFSYLFINLLLIDVRSSIPSLLSKLNSTDYPDISKRLAAAFDVISSFIGFLVRSLELQDVSTSEIRLSIPPDLLLQLRKNIAETMSLTIEYLRDRWDASIAGVSGLHREARTGTSVTSAGTRLTLTWDSMKDNVGTDPLILASIRTLAIWLREDENANLRKESAGLADMLVELYQHSPDAEIDFRYPILMAFEGILVSEEGVDAFLAQDGWQSLSADLLSINQALDVVNAARGIEIIRVLLAIIDCESTTEPQESWMTIVTATSSLKPNNSTQPDIIECQIAMLQLSVALLELASSGMQKRHFTKISAILGLANQLSSHVQRSLPQPIAGELEESLQDVIMALENLR